MMLMSRTAKAIKTELSEKIVIKNLNDSEICLTGNQKMEFHYFPKELLNDSGYKFEHFWPNSNSFILFSNINSEELKERIRKLSKSKEYEEKEIGEKEIFQRIFIDIDDYVLKNVPSEHIFFLRSKVSLSASSIDYTQVTWH